MWVRRERAKLGQIRVKRNIWQVRGDTGSTKTPPPSVLLNDDASQTVYDMMIFSRRWPRNCQGFIIHPSVRCIARTGSTPSKHVHLQNWALSFDYFVWFIRIFNHSDRISQHFPCLKRSKYLIYADFGSAKGKKIVGINFFDCSNTNVNKPAIIILCLLDLNIRRFIYLYHKIQIW